MRGSWAFFLCAALTNGVFADQRQQESSAALKKVVEMLTDMQAKGKKEKQDETVRFASFKQFCESTAGEKTRNIAKSKEEIEQLNAGIAKAESDAKVLTKKMAGLEADATQWTADLEKAREERAKEHAAFEEAHADYVDSIDAVARAVELLKKGPGLGFAQVSQDLVSLLQVHGESIPKHKRRVLMSFIQKVSPGTRLLQEAADEGISVSPPEVAAYESSSGGVIEMVESLGDKFDDEKIELEKRETNSRNAFKMMEADLSGQISSAEMERDMKAKTKAERLEDAAQQKGDLAETSAALAEDEKFLHDLNAECEQKSFDYQARQTVRQGEIEAIGKAIEIMTSIEFMQQPQQVMALSQGGVSLVQLRSTARNHQDNLAAVATFLTQRAEETKSRILMLLANKAQADPFKKVKKMVQDMITKLMEEANEAAEHKAFCDAEMGTNKQTRDTKTEEIETLKADMEELSADIAKLASEIADLNTQIEELDGAIAKATAERQEEKEKNQETIQDATAGEQATAKAIAVLKEFYEKAAVPIEQPAPQQGPIKWDNRALQMLNGGASFVQVTSTRGRVPGAPEMEEGQYSGMGNGGVLGLMEVVQSDFAKVLGETQATEADSAKIYDTFMADSSQDKAVKETDAKHKASSKQSKESALATAKKDLRITQDELAEAMAYFEKLKPSCEEKVVSYEERVAQRKAEIESLKEALEILS